jgi:hypothetical protein
MSPLALVPATELVDLNVTLKEHLVSTDDEEPRTVTVHVIPGLPENSSVAEIDLPSAAMVPVSVVVGQAQTTPGVTISELSVELAEKLAPASVKAASAEAPGSTTTTRMTNNTLTKP